jgi:hypothetical protein
MTRLEHRRREDGLSQGDLGDKILYGAATISFLETGRLPIERVTPRLRFMLEQYFSEPLEQLLSPAKLKDPPQTTRRAS